MFSSFQVTSGIPHWNKLTPAKYGGSQENRGRLEEILYFSHGQEMATSVFHPRRIRFEVLSRCVEKGAF
jgi:hypothetical protein